MNMKKKIFALLALVMTAMTASATAGYSLNAASSDCGTIAFTVGGETATTALEGDVVTVTVTPATGYVVKDIAGEWYAAVAATRGIGTLKDVEFTRVEGQQNQWTFKMERANVEVSATYTKLPPAVAVEASDASNEEKEIAGVTMNMAVAEDAAENVKTEQRTNEETGETETVTVIPIVLESINIPATAAVEEITVTVPAEIREGSVVYEVTEIKADAFKTAEGSGKEVVKVVLPETDEPLTIAEGAMKPDNRLLEIETPLALLDDYALMNSLKENFEAVKISATVTPANRYWTFSSGVDCVLPEGVTAYKVIWDAGTPRIVPLEEGELTLKDGRRGIKANNGVLIASQKGNAYEIVASPGNQTSGTKPATTDAKSYEGNCLEPVIEAKNYDAGKILILKNNDFHTIKSSASKVKPCKAVLSLEKINQ